MSRSVQIVLTLVLFTAVMVGAWALWKPIAHGTVDWLEARIGVEWSLALLAAIMVPATAYGWFLHYREGKAARTRSD